MQKFEIGDTVHLSGAGYPEGSKWTIYKVDHSSIGTTLGLTCSNCKCMHQVIDSGCISHTKDKVVEQSPEVDMVKRAELLARKYHKGQEYGNKSYSYHLKSVVRLVEQCYKDHPNLNELIQIAWLLNELERSQLILQKR